jgi:GGDEF domain-containing protein
MQLGPPRRRRARPVADAAIDALLQRVEDLTKGWLLALLEQSPLDEAPSILAADLARAGPRVCAAVVRALADDADLRRIEPGGELELLVSQAGEYAGAKGAESTSRAVDALSAVIWSGLREEISRPDADQISELAQRLALVIELVRGAALRRFAARAPATYVVPSASGGALWMGAVEDEILRSERSGAALSLLLVELEDAERVAAVETESETAAIFGRFAQAVRRSVRRQDILACETDTRAWIIARDAGRPGAEALGSRIAGAVGAAQPWRGAPMTVSIGLAVLGEDGRDRASLVEAAEEARFAAAAGGIEIARGTSRDQLGEPPGGSGPKLVG